jgi:hypothetical protein
MSQNHSNLTASRRDLLRMGGAAAVTIPLAAGDAFAAADRMPRTAAGWEHRPMRWFQLAFTEDDPGQFDAGFWLNYFREIHADGVCLSAGGGIAFYPTRVPYHGRARSLGNHDPFGEMVVACKRQGMATLARVDLQAMNAIAFAAHPEWAAVDIEGAYRRHPTAPDLYLTCAYTSFHGEFVPQVLEEIAHRYPVDGFFGNRWNGNGPCYCTRCKANYRAATGRDVPATVDTTTEEGRTYARWVEERMMRHLDTWNAAIQHRRPHAFFIPGSERRGFVDYDGRNLGRRMRLGFCDRQGRSVTELSSTPGPRAWNAGRYTKELRSFMDGKPTGHIISVGVEEEYRWKDSVQSEAEIRIWAAGAIAHGSRPWIAKFNAKPFDKRWMPVVSRLYNWHHERYLRNTANLARVALVHSSRTPSFLGGGRARYDLEGHERGYYQALLESRIAFDMIDDGFLDPAHLARFRLLILADAAVMSDAQCAQIRAFVEGGGSIVATHQTSLFDENGQRRADFGLADVFGCQFDGEVDERMQNSYLTLRHPHPALAGLKDVARTIGATKRVRVNPRSGVDIPLTLVPSYSDLPMERVYTDQPTSDIPMAVCRSVGRGRVVYLPMDLDRTFDEISHGDHWQLLRAFALWAMDERQPLEVTGPGLVDVAFWRQKDSVAAHLLNLTNPMTMRGSYREPVPVGPYEVNIALPPGATVQSVRLLEAGQTIEATVVGGRLSVQVPKIVYHEVVAVDLV